MPGVSNRFLFGGVFSYVLREALDDSMAEIVGVDPDVFVALVQDCPGASESEFVAWVISRVC